MFHRRSWGAVLVAALAGVSTASQSLPAATQQVVGHTVSVTRDGSRLELELTDGRTLTANLTDGALVLDGETVARYAQAGTAEQWRRLLRESGALSTAELIDAIRGWREDAGADAEPVHDALADLLASFEVVGGPVAAVRSQPDPALQAVARAQDRQAPPLEWNNLDDVPGLAAQIERYRAQLDEIRESGLELDGARIQVGDLTVPRRAVIDQHLVVVAGDVSIFGRVTGNVVAVDGDILVRSSGLVEGDAVALNGAVRRTGGTVRGAVRAGTGVRAGEESSARSQRVSTPSRSFTLEPPVQAASLLGMFVALACIGFGFSFFMPRQLDIVSETVTEFFGKSFLAGFFAQPLLFPLFAMLLVGLAITIVGILLIPLAFMGFFLLVLAAGVGGYLAVAKAVGTSYLTRRMARGYAVRGGAFRGMLYGLGALMAIWVPAVVLGWVPGIGQVLTTLAAIFTWVMATAGFGAAILSRAGLRATFARPGHQSALTDEYYWPAPAERSATPDTKRRER